MRLRLALIVTVLLPLAALASLTAGCGNRASRLGSYETLAQDPGRDTRTASLDTDKAAARIDKAEYDAAEKILKAALTADPFYGPAHNNLGAVYYHQKKFYLAAWEFQYAAKLMPYSPEPRNNLGMVYEAVSRLDEAERWYNQALTLEPDNPVLIGNLARARVRSGQNDQRTYQLLQDLVLKDTRPDWASWARERLTLMRPGEAELQPPITPQTPAAPTVTPAPTLTPESLPPQPSPEPQDESPDDP